MDELREFLSDGRLIAVWVPLAVLSCAVLVRDLRVRNRDIVPMMRFVWFMTVVYSGPLGLAVYYFAGRRQIPRDSVWRKGFRSVAHCYSGCGAGEITGVLIAAGLLELAPLQVALVTFAFAYLFGYAMTFGPLVQEGVPVRRALIDTFYSDTATIAVMEITAIGVDLWLAAAAPITAVLFWSSLIVSLTVGLVAAYPVNVLLVQLGIKGGMGDPRASAASHTH